MSAFDYDSLWNKSRKFVRRAIAERHDNDFEGFCLWAAIALEVLGKAALAHIHSALVADPQDQESIFAACGRALKSDVRSIPAKTVFLRVGRISKKFDKTQQDFCLLMACRRNADLHSGETPYVDLNPDTWVPQFWRAAELMLEAHGKKLLDWIGKTEAVDAESVIKKAKGVLEQAVEARVRKHKDAFEGDYPIPALRVEAKLRAKGGGLVAPSAFGHLDGNARIPVCCPACGCDALLSGEELSEEVSEVDSETGVEFVTLTYGSLALRCGVCALRLDGQEQLEIAGLQTEFELDEAREPSYGEEYMNE